MYHILFSLREHITQGQKMFQERKFHLKEHDSFVLNLNVTDPLAKDSDFVKEYRTSSCSDKLKKRGGGKARCQSSCCIVDRSTDPFYLGVCSRR